MSVTACVPCGCIPGNISDQKFKQDVEIILCEVLTAVSGGGGVVEDVLVTNGAGVAAVNIQDGGNSITVDGTVTVIQPTGANLHVVNDASTAVIGHVIVDSGTLTTLTTVTGVTAITGSVTPGTGTSNLGKAEDAPAVSGDTLVAIAVQRADVEGDTTSTNGDYATAHEFDGRLSVTNRDRIFTGTLDMTNGAATVGPIDLDSMASVAVYAARTTETGTILFQVSIDGTTYVSLIGAASTQNQPGLFQQTFAANGTITPASLASTATLPCAGYKFFRVKVSATGTGSALPVTIRATHGSNILGVGWLNPGTQSTDLGKASSTLYASGHVGPLALAVNNKNGAAFNSTQLDYSPSAVNDYGSAMVNRGGLFSNILTATTTTVKSGAGFLHRIIVNKAVATSVITIYDNTAGSGTKVGTVTQPAAVVESQTVLEYGLRFGTGLTIVTSSTDDITVVYD